MDTSGFEGFQKEMLERVQEKLGKGCWAELHQVMKVNVGKRTALSIWEKEGDDAPNYYLEEYYRDHVENGRTTEQIATEIVRHYKTCYSTDLT